MSAGHAMRASCRWRNCTMRRSACVAGSPALYIHWRYTFATAIHECAALTAGHDRLPSSEIHCECKQAAGMQMCATPRRLAYTRASAKQSKTNVHDTPHTPNRANTAENIPHKFAGHGAALERALIDGLHICAKTSAHRQASRSPLQAPQRPHRHCCSSCCRSSLWSRSGPSGPCGGPWLADSQS